MKNNKKHIVFVSRLYLPHLGGVEIHIKEIAALLIREGYEVSVVTHQHDKKLALETEYDGVSVYRIPFVAAENKQLTWDAIREYSSVFESAEVVHVHDVFWWILPLYLKIKSKTFITFHGWETEFPIPLNAKIHRFIAAHLTQGVIHIGEYIQEYYWDQPDAVLYGGINPKRFTKSQTSSSVSITDISLPKNNLQVVFVGRLEADTEVPKYIELVTSLKNSGINTQITWVGDGSLQRDCEQIGEVVGFVKNVSKHVAKADLVFATSYLSILEAQMLGKIVCAFYSNPLKESYLKKYPGSSYMLISHTVETMLNKIKVLLGNSRSYKETSVLAQDFAKKMTWDNVLNSYLQLWGRLPSDPIHRSE